MSVSALPRIPVMLAHQRANALGGPLVDVEELEPDPVSLAAALLVDGRQVPDRGAHVGGLGALDDPDGLHRPHWQGRERFHEGATGSEVAHVQRLEGLHGTPQLPDDFKASGHPTIG
jgi:hypothetical protein